MAFRRRVEEPELARPSDLENEACNIRILNKNTSEIRDFQYHLLANNKLQTFYSKVEGQTCRHQKGALRVPEKVENRF